MKPAGYSGTPLSKKIGLKAGFSVRLINQPDHYFDLFPELPDIDVNPDPNIKKNCIHFFTKEAADLEKVIPRIKKEIRPDGMIWVSWPKKASKIPTDVTEDTIRDIALQNGLVDVKVCAVDEIWSALKLVIPVKDR